MLIWQKCPRGFKGVYAEADGGRYRVLKDKDGTWVAGFQADDFEHEEPGFASDLGAKRACQRWHERGIMSANEPMCDGARAGL